MNDDVKVREAAERRKANKYAPITNLNAYTKQDADNAILADAYLDLAARPVPDCVRGIVQEAVEKGCRLGYEFGVAGSSKSYSNGVLYKQYRDDSVADFAARLAPFLCDTLADASKTNFVALTTPNFAALTTLASTIVDALDDFCLDIAPTLTDDERTRQMVTIVIGHIAQAFKLDIRYDPANTPSTPPVLACNMPPQPGDDEPVNPNHPNGPTMGELFGRKKPVDPNTPNTNAPKE